MRASPRRDHANPTAGMLRPLVFLLTLHASQSWTARTPSRAASRQGRGHDHGRQGLSAPARGGGGGGGGGAKRRLVRRAVDLHPLVEANQLPEIYLTIAGFVGGSASMWFWREQGPSPHEVASLSDEEQELAEKLEGVRMELFETEAMIEARTTSLEVSYDTRMRAALDVQKATLEVRYEVRPPRKPGWTLTPVIHAISRSRGRRTCFCKPSRTQPTAKSRRSPRRWRPPSSAKVRTMENR